jgi:hypothetical protein
VIRGVQLFYRAALVVKRLESYVEFPLLLLKLGYFLLELGDLMLYLVHFWIHIDTFLLKP